MLFVYRFHCFLIKFVSLVLKKSLYHLSNEKKKKGLPKVLISSLLVVWFCVCSRDGPRWSPRGPGSLGQNFF